MRKILPEEKQSLIEKWQQYAGDFQPDPTPDLKNPDSVLDSIPLNIGGLERRDATDRLIIAILGDRKYDPSSFRMEWYGAATREHGLEFTLNMAEYLQRGLLVEAAWSQFFREIYVEAYDGSDPDEFPAFLKAMGFDIDTHADYCGHADTQDSPLNGTYAVFSFFVTYIPEWAVFLTQGKLSILTVNVGRGGWSSWSAPFIFEETDDVNIMYPTDGSVYCARCHTYHDTDDGWHWRSGYDNPAVLELREMRMELLYPISFFLGIRWRWLPLWLAWFLIYRRRGKTLQETREAATQQQSSKSPQSRQVRWNLVYDNFLTKGRQVTLPAALSNIPIRFKALLARQQFRFTGNAKVLILLADSEPEGNNIRCPYCGHKYLKP